MGMFADRTRGLQHRRCSLLARDDQHGFVERAASERVEASRRLAGGWRNRTHLETRV
jgi:hypothetical protein